MARLIMRQEGHQCGPGTRLIMNALVGLECVASLHAQDSKALMLSAFSTAPRGGGGSAAVAAAAEAGGDGAGAGAAGASAAAAAGGGAGLDAAPAPAAPAAAEWAIRSFCIRFSRPEDASAVLEAIQQQKQLLLSGK